MHDGIVISNKGEFGEIHRYKNGKVVSSEISLIPYLNEAVEIEEGVTFEMLMNHIMEGSMNRKDASEVFASHLGHYNLDDFYDEWRKKPPITARGMDGMTSLEIGWFPMDVFSKTDPNQVSFRSTRFDGVGLNAEGAEEYYGIEYTALNELKPYMVRIDNKLKVIDWDNDMKTLLEMPVGFTVYDLIGAVLYEISWAGSPTHRDAQMKDILRDVEEAQRQLSKEDPFSKKKLDIN